MGISLLLLGGPFRLGGKPQMPIAIKIFNRQIDEMCRFHVDVKLRERNEKNRYKTVI